MDSILERLCALATADASSSSTREKVELVAEAQALWRTLEMLIATMRTQDLSVGDATFTKLLACVRTVLREPESWRVHAADRHDRGVFEFVNRVLVKLGCRGERERQALTHSGVVALLVSSMQRQRDSSVASATALQVLQTLAFDAQNRPVLDSADTLSLALALLTKHPRDAHVQVFGCKFLQLMAYDEACKEKLVRSSGDGARSAVSIVLDALRRVPNDAQLAASVLDLVYFLSADELESSAPTATQQPVVGAMDDDSVVECVLQAMRDHCDIAQVQTNGMAILAGLASHAIARRKMCVGNVWELVLGVLSSSGQREGCSSPGSVGNADCSSNNDARHSGGDSDASRSDGSSEAASDAIDLLAALLADPVTFDTLAATLVAPATNDRAKQRSTQHTLEALLPALAAAHGAVKKRGEVQDISFRLQTLLAPTASAVSTSTTGCRYDSDGDTDRGALTASSSGLSLHLAENDRSPDCSRDRLLPASECNDSRSVSLHYATARCDYDSVTVVDSDTVDPSDLPLVAAAAPVSIERKLFASATSSTRLPSPLLSNTDALDSPVKPDALLLASPSQAMRSHNSNNALLELALPTSDASRFLDDLAIDSSAGGYFDKFLRAADDRFRPTQNIRTEYQQHQYQQQQAPPPSLSHDSLPLYDDCKSSVATLPQATHAVASATSSRRGMANSSDAQRALLLESYNSRECSDYRHESTAPTATVSTRDSIDHPDDSASSDTWRVRYERCADELRALTTEHQNLHEHCRVVSRRAHEQSRLLNLQNRRAASHMEIHAQVLARVHALEAALAQSTRTCEIERELRRAEVAQCEHVTAALHNAQQQLATLQTTHARAARELQHLETLRVDRQLKASAVKHQTEQVALERDDAVVQAHVLRFDKLELSRQLDDCRRECLEALRMREEDADALRPRVFASVRSSGRPRSPSTNARSRHATFDTTVSARCLSASWGSTSGAAVQPIDASVTATLSSSYSIRTSPRKPSAVRNVVDDDSANIDPERIEREDIEASLQTIYDAFDMSLDGHGVHVATIRRFVLESGLVQSPHVDAADVDAILAKVLAESQEHRRRATVRRRDYSDSSPPTPAAPLASARTATDARRFRYLDQDAFNEAIALVAVKRYPRLDVERALQTAVTEYLHPIQRRMRAATMRVAATGSSASSIATATTLHRSHSTGSALTTSSAGCSSPARSGSSSQSSVSSSVLRTILNNLALQTDIGRSDSNERVHSLQPSSSYATQRTNRVFAMLEMHAVLAREQRPLGTICAFYSALYHTTTASAMRGNSSDSDAASSLLGVRFELVLHFAMDFELVPAFMDRVSLRHVFADVAALVKAALALPQHYVGGSTRTPFGADAETLKLVAFSLLLARLAVAVFGAKPQFETPEQQVTALLQWLDNSNGRAKLLRRSALPLVIKFSRKLYAPHN